jgi:hypothetical protein
MKTVPSLTNIYFLRKKENKCQGTRDFSYFETKTHTTMQTT